MAFGRNQEEEMKNGPAPAAPGEPPVYLDQVQAEVQETGEGPDGEVMDVSTPEGTSGTGAVEVNEDEEAKPDAVFSPAHQVAPDFVIFVPFEDFEGRINQDDFSFVKGQAVKVTTDQANTWLDAKKGYVK